MHPAGKIVIGIILLLVGLGLFANSFAHFAPVGTFWWNNFLIVLSGIIPIFLVIIGLFLIWLEADELKVQKELKREKGKTKSK